MGSGVVCNIRACYGFLHGEERQMTRPRCALGRVVASGVDTETMKRTAWLRDRILVVRMDDDRLTINDLAALWDIGARLYPAKGQK